MTIEYLFWGERASPTTANEADVWMARAWIEMLDMESVG